jgi:hypothetical protein
MINAQDQYYGNRMQYAHEVLLWDENGTQVGWVVHFYDNLEVMRAVEKGLDAIADMGWEAHVIDRSYWRSL